MTNKMTMMTGGSRLKMITKVGGGDLIKYKEKLFGCFARFE